MKKWLVTNLDSLSKDLDIFDSDQIPDPGLLKSGLTPPMPVSGNFLVHGFSLLEMAKKCGVHELFVVELPEMGRYNLLALCLTCEARAGKYSWGEIERMADFLNNNDAMDAHLINLILAHDDPNFTKRVNTYKDFSPSVKQLVAQKALDFKTAEDTSGLPDTVFSRFLRGMPHGDPDGHHGQRFSFSQIRIFLITLDEIARRDYVNESEIIALCDECLSYPDPLETIKRQRFPELTRLYQQLKEIKDSTVRGKGIELIEPPFFEGDAFEVRFRFRSKKQLEKRIGVLKELLERTGDLFELL